MGARGRKSKTELTVLNGGKRIERPAPPAELGSEAAAEWNDIANRLPADWFTRETWPLLVQYCRHVVAARRVADAIETVQNEVDEFNVKAWADLLRLQQKESAIICSLATKMRIAQQSTYDKSKVKGKAGMASAKRPWDDE